MIPLESKLIPQRGHKLEHKNKEDQLQNSSSLKLEGIELRFLVCSILLVDLCQFYSYDAPWDQNWPHPEGHKLEPKEERCRIHLWGK